MDSAAADSAHCDGERKHATGGCVKCDGVVSTLTEDSEVASVTKGGMDSADDDSADCDGEREQATGGRFKCEGVMFTLTEDNEVAWVTNGGATGSDSYLDGSESFLNASTGTRCHFVDVQGKAEAMLFLVSVQEDQRRILAVQRLS